MDRVSSNVLVVFSKGQIRMKSGLEVDGLSSEMCCMKIVEKGFYGLDTFSSRILVNFLL